MFAISNAMLSQAEIEQKDRWKHGPLEFIFFDVERHSQRSHAELVGLVAEWNRGYEGGLCRNGEDMEALNAIVPGIVTSKNPNVFVTPQECGFSELDVMLASVV